MLCCSEACARRACSCWSRMPDRACVQRLVRRLDPLQGGDRIDLAALDFGLDLGQRGFHRGHRAGKLRVRAGLDHRLGLGQVLGGVDDGGLEAAAGLVEASGDLGDGADQHVRLVQALFGCPDGDGGEAALARGELLLGRGGGVLHEVEPFLGLVDVVARPGPGRSRRTWPAAPSATVRRWRSWPRPRAAPAPTAARACGAFFSSSRSESKSAFCSCSDASAASERRMISPSQVRCCSSVSGMWSSSCCCSLKDSDMWPLASCSAFVKFPTAASPYCAWAKPSSCSLDLMASSASISSEPLLRRSSSTVRPPADPAPRPAARSRRPEPGRPSSGGCGGRGTRPRRRRPRRRLRRGRRCPRRRRTGPCPLPPPAASPMAAAVSMAACAKSRFPPAGSARWRSAMMLSTSWASMIALAELGSK